LIIFGHWKKREEVKKLRREEVKREDEKRELKIRN